MGIEFELKYKATPEALAAVAAAVEGERACFEMRTAYYDTVHRQLARRHWTLRRRIENGRSICTLKMPLPNGDRGEYQLECDRIEEAVLELCKLSGEPALAVLAAGGLQEPVEDLTLFVQHHSFGTGGTDVDANMILHSILPFPVSHL